jgi:hypothetical protein
VVRSLPDLFCSLVWDGFPSIEMIYFYMPSAPLLTGHGEWERRRTRETTGKGLLLASRGASCTRITSRTMEPKANISHRCRGRKAEPARLCHDDGALPDTVSLPHASFTTPVEPPDPVTQISKIRLIY